VTFLISNSNSKDFFFHKPEVDNYFLDYQFVKKTFISYEILSICWQLTLTFLQELPINLTLHSKFI